MANTAAVKLAVLLGEYADARHLIGGLIEDDPSAETYYMAAQLEISPAKAESYLKQALTLEPEHAAALRLMDMLTRRGITGAHYAN